MAAPAPRISLTSDVSILRGVGPRVASRLRRIGISVVGDLLFHLPNRYLDQTRVTPIGALQVGQHALVQGEIELTQVSYRRRRFLMCRISDGTGALLLRFFHFSRYQQNKLERGAVLRCWGQARRGPNMMEMIHPEYSRLEQLEGQELDDTLTPVYPGTEGLSQRKMRLLVNQAITLLDKDTGFVAELIPEELRRNLGLVDIVEAVRMVHRPPPDVAIDALMSGTHPVQKRLAFEELLAHQISLKSFRENVRKRRAPVLSTSTASTSPGTNLIARLPFAMTSAQQRVLRDIRSDLAKTIPMLRLLQGDVGCGKTVVAAVVAMDVVASGFQTAIMAPTELLAEQHYSLLYQWLQDSGIRVHLLTSARKGKARANLLAELDSEQALIVVGTHALFQEQVRFGRLGLVIIDEQHRFGVHQRLALLKKGGARDAQPHQLILTATPIPRTLAMTVFADLDISIIDELPPGRKPVRTSIVANDRRAQVVERIAEECQRGKQAYWVCTLIEESESIQSEAALATYQFLQEALTELQVGLVHGRMNSSEKDNVITRFKDGQIQLLVATTVIEVGIDVPNASLMIIENAERLGLAQLHQLRGRVGRGSELSDCVLLYQAPLTELAQARLQIMRQTADGFAIAEKDLELRGPGDMLGTRQTGLPALRIADILRDVAFVPDVQRAAEEILARHGKYAARLVERWIGSKLSTGGV